MSERQTDVEPGDLLDDEDDDQSVSRFWALAFVIPFLLLGLADLLLLLFWGLNPLWGFMILPPILFMSALTWIAFRTGFVSDRTED